MEAACRKHSRLMDVILQLLLYAGCIEASKNSSTEHPLRFWIDEYAFSDGETTILREEIAEAGTSIAVLAGETRSTFLSVKGYYAPDQWDIYWTGMQGCVQALPHALPGHKISCVPGLHELTQKDKLVARLTQFYGEGAFEIIPRSYLLPTQYWQWRLWLAAQEPEDRGEMWVLKEERHRGKGVHVMPLQEAKQKAKARRLDTNYDVAQAYVGNQMTVAGRRFYVRLWAVVTSSFPLRAYLYDGGVVVFGNAAPEEAGRRLTSDDFIVNLWHLGRTTESPPWSVADFRTYVDNLTGSKTAFDALWRGMQRSLGLTFAAGVQAMRFSAASFPVAAASATFELVGIDFLVDEDMKPWLLEVNAVPSLARKVLKCEEQAGGCRADGEAESVFDVEKEKLVHSLFKLLQATAGTKIGLNGTAAGGSHPLSLAELLSRWKSNATDLAALNRTNSTAKASAFADLGWRSGDQAATGKPTPGNAASARSLENSGRELKAAADDRGEEASGSGDDEPETASDAPSIVSATTTAPPIHHVARTQSVAQASNLNKYVPEAERLIPVSRPAGGRYPESHEKILEQHLMETSIQETRIALENRFLPLMMIPEAAAYSAEHQTRGHIFPLPKHKHEAAQGPGHGWASLVLLPFRPVVLAYGGLGHMLERLRVGLVAVLPDINFEVTMGIASTIPGADWLLMLGYRTFSWGDRLGTVEALGVLPQHRLDQRLAEHVKNLWQS